MKHNAPRGVEKYKRAYRRKRYWHEIMTALACIVVFCTVYSLILPAVTLESSDSLNATALTEEEQERVNYVIALIDAIPSSDEIEQTSEEFEEAEDEDGLENYLSGVFPRVRAAYQAYSALSDVEKSNVTNPEKLLELEWIWSAAALDAEFPVLTGDSARVTAITVSSIADGVSPFDENDDAGNDSGEGNKIVRTFDTVTYLFKVDMVSYDNTSYSEARVKIEFVLPLTSDQAVFDQSAMGWMDQTSGYAPALIVETRSINGVDTVCQVLTCYKQLLTSEGNSSVIPGFFTENLTVNVKSMKNGDTFAPVISAAMEHGTWDGECLTHKVA